MSFRNAFFMVLGAALVLISSVLLPTDPVSPDPQAPPTFLRSATAAASDQGAVLTDAEVEFVRFISNPQNAAWWIEHVTTEHGSRPYSQMWMARSEPPSTGAPMADYPNGCGDSCSHDNRRLGWSMLQERGMGEDQWYCLDWLVSKESRWDHLQPNNAGSSAYGVPQALPGSKMGPGWQDDPVVQITWMLDDYIPGRYGTPCDARRFQKANGHY